jgi:hypothetical protein
MPLIPTDEILEKPKKAKAVPKQITDEEAAEIQEEIARHQREDELDQAMAKQPSYNPQQIEIQILKDTIDRLSKIIDAVPFDKLDMILLKFASLKQWKTIKIKDPITHEKITKKVPRWSDPLNTEPDNLMRKSVEKWLADFNAKRSVK